ncbi:MAG: hypothetical protein AAFQ80_20365 [Cyanobacteria bacterium J06621_8]
MDEEELEQRLNNLEQMQNRILENQENIQYILEKEIKPKLNLVHFVVAAYIVLFIIGLLQNISG